MSVQTATQKDMARAAERVAAVKGEPWAGPYGVLCHRFPVMARTCGLCQAVAFSAAKAAGGSGDLARAHQRVLEDLRDCLGVDIGEIARADVGTYMLYTRRVLAAWVFYKRFAVSILKVTQEQEEGTE